MGEIKYRRTESEKNVVEPPRDGRPSESGSVGEVEAQRESHTRRVRADADREQREKETRQNDADQQRQIPHRLLDNSAFLQVIQGLFMNVANYW